MRFEGKSVLITGAAVGIGRACALLMAREGASVALVDINEETLAAAAAELSDCGDRIRTYVCDVRDEEAVRRVCAEAEAAFGKIDILVNNAALWRSHKAFVELPMDEWKLFFDVNVMGTVYFTHALLPGMLSRKYGRVINVASVAGVYGNAKMSHYSATKGAIIAFTHALAKETATEGVTVNAVSPGSVSPSSHADIDYTQASELSFMGRTGSDRENADLICFLASDAAGYISGQNIQIDGCRKKM